MQNRQADISAQSIIMRALKTEFTLPKVELDHLERAIKSNLYIICQRLTNDLSTQDWDNFQQNCAILETLAINLKLRELKTSASACRMAAKSRNRQNADSQFSSLLQLIDKLQKNHHQNKDS